MCRPNLPHLHYGLKAAVYSTASLECLLNSSLSLCTISSIAIIEEVNCLPFLLSPTDILMRSSYGFWLAVLSFVRGFMRVTASNVVYLPISRHAGVQSTSSNCILSRKLINCWRMYSPFLHSQRILTSMKSPSSCLTRRPLGGCGRMTVSGLSNAGRASAN